MTKLSFEITDGHFTKLVVSGHSGYSDEGSDIVCAAISSQVNLAASVLEHGGCRFSMDAGEKTATVIIKLEDLSELGQTVFTALSEQFKALADEFPENVKVTVAERFR